VFAVGLDDQRHGRFGMLLQIGCDVVDVRLVVGTTVIGNRCKDSTVTVG